MSVFPAFRRVLPILPLFFASWALSEEAVSPEPMSPEGVDFAQDVAPILEQKCLACHSPSIRKGELSLATPDDLLELGFLTPGDADGSYLLELVLPVGGDPPRMPAEGERLTNSQVAKLRRWIASGASWPDGLVLREPSVADLSWWSLQPLSEEEPPTSAGIPPDWDKNPLDRFIFAELSQRGLEPNPPADRRALIRRASYDLIGLPPTPEETAAFLSDDSPEAYEVLIGRLLSSPHYGERWGRHWLDVIRFGESRGYERNEIITNLWPFRDYVIRSLNEDKPFNEFIREHLAGDLLAGDEPRQAIGAAFLVCGPYDDVGNSDPAQAARIRADTIDEIIRATGEAFLGLTVGCARCHDHKFDPITQRDYYGLYATFAGVRHGERPIESAAEHRARTERLEPLEACRSELRKQIDELTGAIVARAEAKREEYKAGWIRPAISRRGVAEEFAAREARLVKLTVEGQEQNPNARSGYRIEEFEVWTADQPERNVALASAGGVAHGASREAEDFADAYSVRLVNDGRFGACWIAAGDELVLELAKPVAIRRVEFSSDRAGAAEGRPEANFVCEYRVSVSLDGESWIEVANSHDRVPMHEAHRHKRLLDAEITSEERDALRQFETRLAETEAQIAAVPAPPVWWIGHSEAAPGPFQVFLGGDPQRKGEEVSAASLSALPKVRPYQLAPECEEAERRLALATWITDDGNSLSLRVLANRLWHYHFGTGLVDTPSDFGYMGGRPSHPKLLDWLAAALRDNGWRLKDLHRLIMTSQAYRQSSEWRAQAAEIDADDRLLWRFPPRRLEAEEVRDTMLAVAGKLDPSMGGPGFRLYRYLQDNVATYVSLDHPGPETYRRAVYHHNARASRVDVLTDFDSPDCAFSTPRRPATTTPLQALAMWNHAFPLDMATYLANRVNDEAPQDIASRIERVFALCYQRSPTGAERAECADFVATHGLVALCRVLLASSELIYLE